MSLSRGRVIVEGLVIVLSILVAFAVDAAWDARKARQTDAQVLDAIRTQFQSHRATLDIHFAEQARLEASSDSLVGALSSSEGRVVDVPTKHLRNTLLWPALRLTPSPPDYATVSDLRLRAFLAAWDAEVRTTLSRYDTAQRLVLEHVRPALGEQLDLSVLDMEIRGSVVLGQVPEARTVGVRPDLNLINALSARGTLVSASRLGLTRLGMWADSIEARVGQTLEDSD
jgi:hypothetical protein